MADFTKLCSNCKAKGCCTDSAVPLVFSSDLEDLKSIGKDTRDFLHDRNVNGMLIKAVNKKPDSTECVFWDKQNGCTIYEHRPFDCRAYPFDILKINGEFCWIIYSCNPDSDWYWTEEYLVSLENDKAFAEIMEKIEIFSGNTNLILPQESRKTPYSLIRPVKFQK